MVDDQGLLSACRLFTVHNKCRNTVCKEASLFFFRWCFFFPKHTFPQAEITRRHGFPTFFVLFSSFLFCLITTPCPATFFHQSINPRPVRHHKPPRTFMINRDRTLPRKSLECAKKVVTLLPQGFFGKRNTAVSELPELQQPTHIGTHQSQPFTVQLP